MMPLRMDTAERVTLAGIGISDREEQAYRTLLSRRSGTAKEVARVLGLTQAQVAELLSSLEAKGMVSRTTGRSARYVPAPPDVAVEVLIHRQQERFELARLAARRLLEEFRSSLGRSDPAEIVELLVGAEAIGQRFLQMERMAEKEFLAFDKPPYRLVGSNPEEEPALRRGVRYRVIYSRAALEYPGRAEDLEQWAESGEVGRVLPDVPMKLDIVDDTAALVPFDMYDPGMEAALVIHSSPLLEALRTLFELLWERAIPLQLTDSASEPAEPRPSDDDRQILALMAAGLKDEAMARQLGVTVRTVRRRVSALMRSLDAETRYQAGLQAARRGWYT